MISTVFNGASNIVQKAGIVAVEDEGMKEVQQMVAYYMDNAKIILEGLTELGIEVYGGVNAPYIWARFPHEDSWEVFERILTESHVVTTPGSGFGPSGQEYVRFSAFGHRADVIKAVKRLKERL